MVVPHRRWGDNQEDRNLEADSPSASPMEEGGRGVQPGFRKDVGKNGEGGVAEPAPLQAPLQEAKE